MVDEQFTYEEGQGDRTLESWRRMYWRCILSMYSAPLEIGRSRAMRSTVRRWSGVLAALALTLAGCGSPRPVLKPGELPFHTSDPLGFTLHWRLDRTADAAVAEGVLEAARLDRYSQVTVELAGLDASGAVLSRGRTTATPRDFTGTTPWPFTARLRPTGGEKRFMVRVADVLPKVTPGR